ncbi:MAG: hypothetical protein GY795_07215 [Desulfobacterales bacterium]|nr:hypothetical protein [Desulfobacterales bacterium]
MQLFLHQSESQITADFTDSADSLCPNPPRQSHLSAPSGTADDSRWLETVLR